MSPKTRWEQIMSKLKYCWPLGIFHTTLVVSIVKWESQGSKAMMHEFWHFRSLQICCNWPGSLTQVHMENPSQWIEPSQWPSRGCQGTPSWGAWHTYFKWPIRTTPAPKRIKKKPFVPWVMHGCPKLFAPENWKLADVSKAADQWIWDSKTATGFGGNCSLFLKVERELLIKSWLLWHQLQQILSSKLGV